MFAYHKDNGEHLGSAPFPAVSLRKSDDLFTRRKAIYRRTHWRRSWKSYTGVNYTGVTVTRFLTRDIHKSLVTAPTRIVAFR